MTVERPEQNPTPSGMSIALPAVVVVAILGAAFLAVAGHVLTSQDFTEFLAVWGLVSLVGTVLSSLEWEASRATAASSEHYGARRLADPSSTSAFLTVSVGAAVIATLGMLFLCIWIVPAILHDSWLAAFLLLIAIAGVPFQASTRGILAGQRRVGRFSMILVGEVLIRLLLVPILLLTHANVVGWIAALAAGSWAWVLVSPKSICGRTANVGDPMARQVGSRFAMLLIGSVSYAGMLMAYPAILAAVDADRHPVYVAALGSALVVSRLPALLVLPLLPLLIARLVSRKYRSATTKSAILSVAGGLVAFLVLGAASGPLALRLAFGDRYLVSSWTFGVLLGSCLLLVMTSVLSSDVVARGRHVLSSSSWLAGAVVTGILLSFPLAATDILYPGALLIGSALSFTLMASLVAILRN